MHKATVGRFLNILAVGLVGFGALLATWGTAAEAADPAKSDFAKEWDSLVRAARKEGKLVVAAGGQPSREYRPTFNAFTKKFGVTVQVSSGSAPLVCTPDRRDRSSARHSDRIPGARRQS